MPSENDELGTLDPSEEGQPQWRTTSGNQNWPITFSTIYVALATAFTTRENEVRDYSSGGNGYAYTMYFNTTRSSYKYLHDDEGSTIDYQPYNTSRIGIGV